MKPFAKCEKFLHRAVTVWLFAISLMVPLYSIHELRPLANDGGRHAFNLYQYESCSWLFPFDNQMRLANCLFQIPTLLFLKLTAPTQPMVFLNFYLFSVHALILILIFIFWLCNKNKIFQLGALFALTTTYLTGASNLISSANEGIPFVLFVLAFLLNRESATSSWPSKILFFASCGVLAFSHQSYAFPILILLVISLIERRPLLIVSLLTLSTTILLLRLYHGMGNDPAAKDIAEYYLISSVGSLLKLQPSALSLQIYGAFAISILIAAGLNSRIRNSFIAFLMVTLIVGLVHFSKIQAQSWFLESGATRVLIAPLLAFLAVGLWWIKKRGLLLSRNRALCVLFLMACVQGVWSFREIDMIKQLEIYNKKVMSFATAAGVGCHYIETSKWNFQTHWDSYTPFIHFFKNNQRQIRQTIYARNDGPSTHAPQFDPCQVKEHVMGINYSYYAKSNSYAGVGNLKYQGKIQFEPESLRPPLRTVQPINTGF